ncbi:unnamed protein product [Effrenium voratum]|nr:unnamed protein product [Effrenium voratum]|mmetsp:Transcript_68696/g.163641  ORF Transcript_68696/g.163641 Transcript_68696/m.163641 type:complete len:154 (+) Transcript_68696:87-548(+)|eukprot:CAMPEP_0181413478 /NCGR_PEP_ID=MMETSP1110-20121109/8994_1 /TAXON_ID=174948 /ORGANISM="Symbiodinium sp., Strain CCMP421" /LENGTH=153 /DNA_ID=CAMNT_0023536295 /DNA_START=63 /DNA_END=524 /DNA_ORIENTATION=-
MSCFSGFWSRTGRTALARSCQTVTLDVGGSLYNCDPAVIQKCNYIAQVVASEENFLDRDGNLFAYILDFLKDEDNFMIPNDESVRRRLASEAASYGLKSLQDKLVGEEAWAEAALRSCKECRPVSCNLPRRALRASTGGYAFDTEKRLKFTSA